MAEVDGVELRDQIAEDYVQNSKRMGGTLDMEGAQHLAIADLRTVDAMEREEPPAPAIINSTIIEEEPEEQETAQTMARDIGGRFEKRAIQEESPLRDTLAVVNPEKRIKLVARIAMLCGRDEKGVAMYPRFAALVAQTHANWNLNCKDFRRCSTQADRDKMFFGMLERICDKSNAILPNWWVK